MTTCGAVTEAELARVFQERFPNLQAVGWNPRLRRRFHYFTPDEYYEAMVARLVTENCTWLDVGCGHHIFPSNLALATRLTQQCTLVVGVDPDETIAKNTLVHERYCQPIEQFSHPQQFDVVTSRMVVEHIEFPNRALAALSRLTKPRGKVVLYTVNRWSVVPILTKLIPFNLHHPIKKFLWNTEEEDTFPVFYRMNTRRTLQRLFTAHGFREWHFSYVDDCRTFARFRATLQLELTLWAGLHRLGIRYPENCLLGVYEKIGSDKDALSQQNSM